LLSDRIPGRTIAAAASQSVDFAEGNQRARLAFSPDTGLPQKMSYDSVHVAGPPLPVEETYSDFRDVSGIKIPFHISITQGGEPFADVSVQDYKINVGINLAEISKQP
jgi:hypothetical protein